MKLAQDMVTRRAARRIKQRTDNSLQGQMEYRSVHGILSGGSEHLQAQEAYQPRQLFSHQPVPGIRHPRSEGIGKKYDPTGHVASRVPIAMGGLPVAGYDVNDDMRFMGNQAYGPQVQDFNAYYSGYFQPANYD